MLADTRGLLAAGVLADLADLLTLAEAVADFAAGLAVACTDDFADLLADTLLVGFAAGLVVLASGADVNSMSSDNVITPEAYAGPFRAMGLRFMLKVFGCSHGKT